MRIFIIILIYVLTNSIATAQLVFSDPIQIPRSTSELGVGDFDHDGHVDIAIAGGQQRWYAGPDFTTWHLLGLSDGGPYAARVADMNGDGWDDFITSDGSRTADDIPGELYVYLNPTDTGNIYQPWQRILVYQGNVRHQNDLRIADMDGDGLLDIIERTWSSERVVVALQNPDINNWTVRVFDTGETGKPEGISAGDIDGDGDQEIVLSGVYWDNPGGWRSGDPIEYSVDPLFVQEEVKSAVGDIDNDGDNDIYMGSAEGGFQFLAWYENTGISGGGVTFIKHIIKDNFGKCHMVELIDIDFDGDLDLCTAQSFGEDGCLIYYNENNGQSWSEQNYDSDGRLYTGVVRDLDADGDYDIIGPYGFYGTVRYYINETPGVPPAAPYDLEAALIEGRDITLSWIDTISNEGTFQIERAKDSIWTPLATLPANTTSYLDDQTESGTLYQYRILAANAAGVSAYSYSDSIATWQQAGQITISPTGGPYVDTVEITLSASLPYDEVRYTLDGSEPLENSMLYQGPFMIGISSTVKAAAFGTELIPSETVFAEYVIATNGNFPPIADAGADVQYFDLSNVTLDGSNSSDLDDISIDYAWQQISGPSVTIVDATAAMASFAPSIVGIYRFELAVSDEIVTDRDTVEISVSDLDENLIAYWPADEMTSMTAAMEVINGYDAILNGGATFTPHEGKTNGAILFDGITGAASVPGFDVVGDQLTIAFWMKANDLSNVEGRMISKASGPNGNQHYWMVSQITGSGLRFRLNTANGGTETLVTAAGELSIDQWYYIAAVYDGSTMSIYKNGTLIVSTSKTGNITTDGSVPIAIGNQPPGAGDRPFSGYLDEIKMYDTALSAVDIMDIFNNTCDSYLNLSNLTIDDDASYSSRQRINLENVTIQSPAELILKSKSINIGSNVNVDDGAKLTVIYQDSCED